MIVKRTFDFVFAFLGLLLLSPVLVIFMLLVFFQDKSSPIYKAPRVGLNGKIFTMVKMRSMVVDADRTKVDSTSSDDLRITPIGQTIRKYKLDELMQLWNVFIGEMSLVGPRPLLVKYLDRYNDNQLRRLEVKPGLTGWAQINGRNSISWEEKFQYDVWYVDNRSLKLDLIIIFKTIGQVIRGKGISQKNHPTMEEFMGTNK